MSDTTFDIMFKDIENHFKGRHNLTEEEYLNEVTSVSVVDTILKNIADCEYVRYYTPDRSGVGSGRLIKIMQTVKEFGISNFQNAWDEGEFQEKSDFYNEEAYGLIKNHGDVREIFDAISEFWNLKFGTGSKYAKLNIDETDIKDDLRTALSEILEEKDDSTIMDAIADHETIEVTVSLTENNEHLDHGKGYLSITTVYPDHLFANFLSFLNISSDEYIAYIRDNIWEEFDPKSAGFWDKKHEDICWDYENDRFRLAWDKFQVEKRDSNSPALIDWNELKNILNESSYGGYPCMAMQLYVKKFLSDAQGIIDANKSQNLSEDVNPADMILHVVGNVGIGIHDDLNGSGYIALPEHCNIQVPLSDFINAMKITDGTRTSIDNVFGILESYLRPAIYIERKTSEPKVNPGDEPQERRGPHV